MQKVLYTTQIFEYTEFLDERMIHYIGNQEIESFESFAEFSLMAFDWYDVHSDETSVSRILIYLDRDDLFFFCADERAFTRCTALLTEGNSNEKALYLFFVGLLTGDSKRLEQFEIDITNAEDAALDCSRADYLKSIREFKKELLRMKRYYEQLGVIADHLCANDNALFSKEGARHFFIIHNRVSHFSLGVLSLRDYVTQMREACQAQLDLEQNNLMRIFTVIAAVFLPLTLIVGWYGMNFTYMPELGWRYGYLGVIVLSIGVCAALIAWFKRKKWF